MSLLNNARWVAMSQACKIGAQVVGMMVLARLVAPDEYGLMAMAAVVTNFAIIFRDMGSSAAIIQRQVLDDETKTTVFWFNICVGTTIAVVVVAIAPWMVQIFNAPRLFGVLLLMALAFPISSCTAAHQALLERESKFKAVARVEIISTMVGLVVAIAMGWAGMGVYSLVAQTLIMMGLSSLQLWLISDWHPGGFRQASWPCLRSIFGFSSNLVGFNIINYFSRNADNIIIGHYFAAAVLGAYSLAYRVMLFPLQSLTFVVSRSMYPLLSKQQSNMPLMRQTYLKVVAVIAALVAPMMAGMLVLREQFIELFLGKGWELSSLLLLWLAPTGFIQSILSTTGVVFMATAATRTLMMLGVVGAVLQVGAFMLGIHGGVELMVKFYLLANIVNAVPVLILCMKQLEGTALDLIRVTWVPVVSAIVMAFFVDMLENVTNLGNSAIVLSVGAFGGLVFYMALYFILDRRTACEMLSSLRFRNG
ncbi:MAG: lipopolysaccharide biosynthesis protein [Pseudomonas sp.]